MGRDLECGSSSFVHHDDSGVNKLSITEIAITYVREPGETKEEPEAKKGKVTVVS